MALEALRLEKRATVRHANLPFVGGTAAIITLTIWAIVLIYALAPDTHLAVVASGHVKFPMTKVIVVFKRAPIERQRRTG
jgi:hypothetical protein